MSALRSLRLSLIIDSGLLPHPDWGCLYGLQARGTKKVVLSHWRSVRSTSTSLLRQTCREVFQQPAPGPTQHPVAHVGGVDRNQARCARKVVCQF